MLSRRQLRFVSVRLMSGWASLEMVGSSEAPPVSGKVDFYDVYGTISNIMSGQNTHADQESSRTQGKQGTFVQHLESERRMI